MWSLCRRMQVRSGVSSMTLEDVKRILEAEVIVGSNLLNQEVKMACGSDLMSDVLAFIKPETLLLTGLTNSQSVRTAEIANIKAIIYVRGKMPDKEAINLAREYKIPLLSTKLYMFEACGKLYRSGLVGISEWHEVKDEYAVKKRILYTSYQYYIYIGQIN